MMKRALFLSLIAMILVQFSYAQENNSITFNNDVRQLSNGWHKFQLQGATFDVEIAEGHYVKGNISWLDGTTYSGNLAGASIAGRGTYVWPDGSRYEGSFKKNKRHGKGTMIAADGSKWSGKWKHNKKNGKGKLFDAEGSVVQQGVWEEDQLIEAK